MYNDSTKQSTSSTWYSRFFTWTSLFHKVAFSLVPGDTVIHVIDDIRQIRKDFFCKQSQLLEHMKCPVAPGPLGQTEP